MFNETKSTGDLDNNSGNAKLTKSYSKIII